MKRTARLLLVCLMFALLAVSHNAFAAKKAKAVADQVNATTTAVTDQANATTTAVANQANTTTAAVANQASVTTQKTNQVVSLNSATAAQLTQIKGIGSKTADAIIAKRTELGGRFTSIDQLLEVKGIKQKKLDKIKPFLSL